jgi:hypothetical protein
LAARAACLDCEDVVTHYQLTWTMLSKELILLIGVNSKQRIMQSWDEQRTLAQSLVISVEKWVVPKSY